MKFFMNLSGRKVTKCTRATVGLLLTTSNEKEKRRAKQNPENPLNGIVIHYCYKCMCLGIRRFNVQYTNAEIYPEIEQRSLEFIN